ncbi:putative fungal-specific transcription factor [Talaromyces proteolyticus]|uniref:Fungal-specific transcription factor n=1 Tax=Talaromyces proteolyticus TaxID=1131652 RepID=A0AAD4PZH9_9EURO|nr:putative fungal-specific transcription factor [Talaromyces proteolyticus]KAH8699041.1 putative fungal-specific transcription factor [Talaromyces proteolyticus]
MPLTNFTVSCHRCHTHKIKCSGDQPCSKCIQVGHQDECTYFFRDRKVRVSENYLQQLQQELRHLKEHSAVQKTAENPSDDGDDAGPSCPAETAHESDETNASIQHHFIGEKAWFHPYDPSAPPIYIGEAACTAFATRLRRTLTMSNAASHIPRTQYVNETTIASAMEAEVQWPSLQQSRLLVKIAMLHVGRLYHMFLYKSTLDKLEEIYRDGSFYCPENRAKYFALFAFGEAYSVRQGLSTESVPGTTYFAKALNLIQIVPERPSMTHLETLLLLSLFSYFLNRRHSACVLSGNAMRLSLNIGLNHNIPESQLIDPVERQHRIRIWWTIYIFDHMWSSKMGLPMQISDDDIHIDMPFDIVPAEVHNEQFTDTGYMVANIKLARIAGDIITKLYSRKKYKETFLQRVQGLLKALRNWVQTLTEHLRLNPDPESNKKHIISLHLSFNQCVILTTRPTMLHILNKINENEPPHTRDYSNRNGESDISHAVLTLSEACIHAARHSHSIILEKWINGSLPVFGYFHAQYLFSSAMILAVSSLISNENTADRDSFETALRLLHAMKGNGNLTAAEFYPHLNQIKICLDSRVENNRADEESLGNRAAIGPDVIPPASSILQGSDNDPDVSLNNAQHLIGDISSGYTTEMAFLEPTMENFLAQSDLALGLPHAVDSFMNDAESLYTYITPTMLSE